MVFESVAPDRDTAENSLSEHIEAMESEDGIEIVEKEEDEVQEIENPHPDLETGFNSVVEIEAEFDDYAKAMETVINYGPTYVQMEGPDHYDLSLKESQEALQSVVNTMHQYAQMGKGGVLISRSAEEE